jgi:DNA-binding Lrp family transcriptional regulator
MDTLDRKILAELQVQGRLSTTDLASRVGLTVAPTHRRVGYRAVIDPRALGLNFEALVFVTMKQEDRATLLGFEEAAAAVPNILQAYRLFGDPDFLLRVRTTDLEAYTRLQDDVLATLPGVQRFTSTLVMKDVVGDRPYPTH